MFGRYSMEEKRCLYEALRPFFSERRQELFDRLAPLRTRHISVLIEDIYQPHNASAVLRSCDCFGVQDVHVVERHNRFNPAGDVAVGSSKWVDYYKYGSISDAVKHLRGKGYRIVATLPHENDTLIADLDISRPTVLMFGTELTGLTQEAIDLADSYVKIPMYGFTESFNISVSAALCLYSVTERMRKDEGIDWRLTEEEQLTLQLEWAVQTIKDGAKVAEQVARTLGL